MHYVNYSPTFPDELDLSRFIFIAGFARGGTTWTRKICALHPEIDVIDKEVVFDARGEITDTIVREKLFDAMTGHEYTGNYIAMKAPANALSFPKLSLALPKSKFVFIARDPRDVFTSFKESEVAWMGGRNKEVAFCLSKQMRHSQAFEEITGRDHAIEVRYERFHQAFRPELRRLAEFLGVRCDDEIVNEMAAGAAFHAMNGRDHDKQNRKAGARKGVMGEWGQALDQDEKNWIAADPYWAEFIEAHGYAWDVLTLRQVLTAALGGPQDPALANGRIGVVARKPLNMNAQGNLTDIVETLNELGARPTFAITPRALDRSRQNAALYDSTIQSIGGEFEAVESLELHDGHPMRGADSPLLGTRSAQNVTVVEGIMSVSGLPEGVTLSRDAFLRALADPSLKLFIDAGTGMDAPLSFAYRLS